MSDARSHVPRQRQIELPGRGSGAMAFLDYGDRNRPVDAVFVHANGFNALTYQSALGPLSERFHILAIDQRGHGGTRLEANPTGRRDWFDLRDDLLSFLAAFDLEGIVLGGHSMGATACLLAAAEEPSRCGGLVLVDPVVLPPNHGEIPPTSPIVQSAQRRRATFPSRAEALNSYRGRGAFKTWPESTLADYVRGGFRDSPDGQVTLACAPEWEASGFSAHGHDPWRAFQQTKCPITILRADIASTFNLAGAGSLDPARIHIETILGSTHFLPMECPERVRTALSETILAAGSGMTRASALA